MEEVCNIVTNIDRLTAVNCCCVDVIVAALLCISRHHQNIKVTLFLAAMHPRSAYLVIQYNACYYVASDILNMALVNLPINGLQIYSVK